MITITNENYKVTQKDDFIIEIYKANDNREYNYQMFALPYYKKLNGRELDLATIDVNHLLGLIQDANKHGIYLNGGK